MYKFHLETKNGTRMCLSTILYDDRMSECMLRFNMENWLDERLDSDELLMKFKELDKKGFLMYRPLTIYENEYRTIVVFVDSMGNKDYLNITVEE